MAGRLCAGRGSRDRAGALAALATFALVATAPLGCGGAKRSLSPATPGVDAHPVAPAAASALVAKRALDASRAPATSHRIATIAKSAIGPFVARSGDAAIAAWMVAADRGGQELFAVPLAADGAPVAEPHVVATVSQEATTLVVRATGGAHGGWLLAWSALLDRGESLVVLSLSRDGAARGAPADVARTSDHIKWCDVIPTTRGAVAVWAEETNSGDANILADVLSGEGRPLGMPVRVARGIDRWQAVPVEGADEGVGLALVTSDPHDEHAPAGRLSWLRLDAQGRPRDPVVVSSRPTVNGDIDVAPLADGNLLAWTDRTGEDAQVMLARVDAAGHVTGPTPAMDSVGGSSLVALASGAQGAALAWEEPAARAHPLHALHLATVSATDRLSAQPVTSVEIAAGAPPELTSTSSGFALLAPAHACVAGASTGSCAGPVLPTFVRFDARLAPLQAEPVVLGEGPAATALGWGLRCAGDRCVALAATGETPTPVFAVALDPRTSPFTTPAAAPSPPDAPRLTSLETIASGQPYEDIAAGRLGDATIVATLASPLGNDGERAPSGSDGRAPAAGDARGPSTRDGRAPARGAVLTVRTLDDEGRQRGPTATLTSRGVSIGGIALVPGGVPQDGAAVAWVAARDETDRQVHLARLDRAGRRTKEIELTTRSKGDVSSVAMAWTGDGWLVAWVDGRDGNGEVYATKIDRDLSKVAREERITNAPGDAGDVTLAVHNGVAWLAWSDPRESPREGLADIYATTLGIHDARRASDEVRVLASAPHSRSPQLAPGDGDSAVLAWIEDVATGLEGPAAAMVAVLDRTGRVVRAPSILPLSAEGRPTSIALAPSRDGVRAIVVRSGKQTLTLDAVLLGPDGTPATRPWPLLDVEAPASFDVAVALAGDALLFDDVGTAPGDHHIRRALVAWRR